MATEKERAAQREQAGSLADLRARHLEAAQALEDAARSTASVQQAGIDALTSARDAGDRAATRAAIDSMWSQIFESYRALLALSETWNAIAPEAGEAPAG
jgi:hypothetical protein